MTSRTCLRCHSTTAADVLESAAGESGLVALTVERMPILACAKGHRQFLHPEFPRWLLEHVEEDEERLPAGQEQGLLRKHYHCGECGSLLETQTAHRETFRFDMALGDASPFRVALTAPVYRCPACSREQLASLKEIRKRTPQALSQAFQAAGIPPG